ncbi:hypothetical protein D3C87_1689740 [compost metagenome]
MIRKPIARSMKAGAASGPAVANAASAVVPLALVAMPKPASMQKADTSENSRNCNT